MRQPGSMEVSTDCQPTDTRLPRRGPRARRRLRRRHGRDAGAVRPDPEDYGGLAGKCHEALVLNRPDVIEGVHTSMLEAGAEVRRDRHLPGLAAEARRVGARRAHARDQHARRPRSPARPRARRASSPARSARPASCPPPTTRRSARSPSASSSRSSPSRRSGLVEGGADLIIIETAQDILEVKAAIFGAREAFKATGRDAADPDLASRCCRRAARCCSAPTSRRC